MGNFILTSDYKPTGDQPEAIRELTDGIERGDKSQVLLGVTGSGKTFTMANVIANCNRPTLILSHNKTLAHQLYMEMKEFLRLSIMSVITTTINQRPICLRQTPILRKISPSTTR